MVDLEPRQQGIIIVIATLIFDLIFGLAFIGVMGQCNGDACGLLYTVIGVVGVANYYLIWVIARPMIN
jgi:hypothetical protein